ncbi:hypothetical protein KKG22_03690 [Patescibacteria group bacterium]|nr:hypothetical protein [Patescibacteria group bacterium]MBU1721249.1 hypothetical protein [Patescibacteria group bacterium]MBU1901043.1 hypothetical protein [Patescibacteria group bacterium]
MKKIFSIAIVSFFSFFLLFSTVYTATLGDAVNKVKTTGGTAGVAEENVANVVGTFINLALSMVGLIFLVLMIYAGYLWMTARGDEGQVEKAMEIIKTSIIGLIIIMSAYAINAFVLFRFLPQ